MAGVPVSEVLNQPGRVIADDTVHTGADETRPVARPVRGPGDHPEAGGVRPSDAGAGHQALVWPQSRGARLARQPQEIPPAELAQRGERQRGVQSADRGEDAQIERLHFDAPVQARAPHRFDGEGGNRLRRGAVVRPPGEGLHLDVEAEVAPAGQGKNLVQGRDPRPGHGRLTGKPAVGERSAVEPPQFGEREPADDPATGRALIDAAPEHRIVADHQDLVGGGLDVELDVVGAGVDGEQERRQRVLRKRGAGAPVAVHGDALVGHRLPS